MYSWRMQDRTGGPYPQGHLAVVQHLDEDIGVDVDGGGVVGGTRHRRAGLRGVAVLVGPSGLVRELAGF